MCSQRVVRACFILKGRQMLYKIIVEKDEERRCILTRYIVDAYVMSNNDTWDFVKVVCEYKRFIDVRRLDVSYTNEFNLIINDLDYITDDFEDANKEAALAEWNLICAKEELKIYEKELLK